MRLCQAANRVIIFGMKGDRKGLARMLSAAKHSMEGFAAAFRTEAAFRQDYYSRGSASTVS